ncbi:MAG: lysine 2,3-aminomutase [Eubacteriales bacterium]
MEAALEVMKQKIHKDTFSEEALTLWKNWKWQLKHVIKDVNTVENVLNIKFTQKEKEDILQTIEHFPMSITPYYLSLIDTEDYKNDPIYKQAFPDKRENHILQYDMKDPLAEELDSPVIGITHRYPDRVLFHISNVCAMYCRHCTRKRKVGDIDHVPSKAKLKKGLEYIKKHPVIRDVLLSGGDPFMLPDDQLDWILEELNKIDHIEVIRIGTRTPVVLPYRITDDLISVLKKHEKTIWINTHFNHPKEITDSSKEALRKLAYAGIPLGNQSVLLADINDCPRIMKRLVHKLVENRVRPYYIYQCDLSEGLEHFRTSVGKGIEIMESLRGHTSGFAVPTYVIDAPGGGGKIPIMPNYLISWSTNKVILRNYKGVITTYQEPNEYRHEACDLKCDTCSLQLKLHEGEESKAIGIAQLIADYDEVITLTPMNQEQ